MAPKQREPLTPERLIAGALELIDREGLGALTLDRLGAEFGVSGMAVYKHLRAKDAILDGVVAGLLAELEPLRRPAPQGDPREHLDAFYRGLWRLYRAHPKVLPALLARPLALPAMRRCLAANTEALTAAGLARPAAESVLATLTAFTLGFAALDAGGYLALTGAGEAAAGQGAAPVAGAVDDLDEAFARGLAALLDGLEAELRVA